MLAFPIVYSTRTHPRKPEWRRRRNHERRNDEKGNRFIRYVSVEYILYYAKHTAFMLYIFYKFFSDNPNVIQALSYAFEFVCNENNRAVAL